MYKAIEPFIDLQDGNKAYKPGDVFPRDGLKVSKARVDELASSSNRRGRPVIALVTPVESPRKAEKPKKAETPEDKPKTAKTANKRGRKKNAE